MGFEVVDIFDFEPSGFWILGWRYIGCGWCFATFGAGGTCRRGMLSLYVNKEQAVNDWPKKKLVLYSKLVLRYW